jgi:hypothetical protein
MLIPALAQGIGEQVENDTLLGSKVSWQQRGTTCGA